MIALVLTHFQVCASLSLCIKMTITGVQDTYFESTAIRLGRQGFLSINAHKTCKTCLSYLYKRSQATFWHPSNSPCSDECFYYSHAYFGMESHALPISSNESANAYHYVQNKLKLFLNSVVFLAACVFFFIFRTLKIGGYDSNDVPGKTHGLPFGLPILYKDYFRIRVT